MNSGMVDWVEIIIKRDVSIDSRTNGRWCLWNWHLGQRGEYRPVLHARRVGTDFTAVVGERSKGQSHRHRSPQERALGRSPVSHPLRYSHTRHRRAISGSHNIIKTLQHFLGSPTWEELVEKRRNGFLNRVRQADTRLLSRRFLLWIICDFFFS